MKHYELKDDLRFIRNLTDLTEFPIVSFYDRKNNCIVKFDMQKNEEIYDDLISIVHAAGLVSKKHKYVEVYTIYEQICSNPELKFNAVRVSLVHSKRKITRPKICSFLMANFGELKISFRNKAQDRLFYEIFSELIDETYALLLSKAKGATRICNGTADKLMHRHYKKVEGDLGSVALRRSHIRWLKAMDMK